MKRDMELIRNLLISIEEQDQGEDDDIRIDAPGYEPAIVNGHLRLLKEAAPRVVNCLHRSPASPISALGPLRGWPVEDGSNLPTLGLRGIAYREQPRRRIECGAGRCPAPTFRNQRAFKIASSSSPGLKRLPSPFCSLPIFLR